MGCGNKKDTCPCTFPCEKKGNCCDCVEHHNSKGQFPACFFSEEAERTGDRSFEALVADRKRNKK